MALQWVRQSPKIRRRGAGEGGLRSPSEDGGGTGMGTAPLKWNLKLFAAEVALEIRKSA
jgi:hypothetical protein